MHVWLISVAEPIPSDNVRPMRFMGLADQLLSRGHRVTVWTTSFFHHTKSHRFSEDTRYQVQPGYDVTVLKSWGYRKNVSIRRFLAHRHFAHRLSNEMRQSSPPDLIFVALPPLDTVSAAIDYGFNNHVPVVVDVIDPWPDVFLTLAPNRQVRKVMGWVLAPLYRQCRNALRKASGITALSQTYIDWALKRRALDDTSIPAAHFYPAVNLEDYPLRNDSSLPVERPIRFVYAGALGKSYDVETIIHCARELYQQGERRAEFLIAGDGPKAASLHQLAEGLPNVQFLGWLGRKALTQLLTRCDVGIAPYARGATQSVTYKLFDYLAAGLPLLNSLSGEMAELIKKEEIGYFFEAENTPSLLEHIYRLLDNRHRVSELSLRARVFAEQFGDIRTVYANMSMLLEHICEQWEYADMTLLASN